RKILRIRFFHFLQALLKVPFTLKINRLGFVSGVKGLDSGVDKFLKETKKISEWEGKVYKSHWSNKGLAVIWNNSFYVFAKKTLQPKMKWKRGPILAFNGTTYLYEDQELVLQSRKKKTIAVVVGVGSQSHRKVDKALNTQGKNLYETRLIKSRSRLVIDADKGVVQQLYGTRSYATDWIASDISVFAFAVKETTTIQLRRNVKEKK
ncbi:MAG: hypothetical protein P1V97_39830, partial [Planctomycetota bacterium]|nr:hypothetical protein [Planctomycetota bacterium]